MRAVSRRDFLVVIAGALAAPRALAARSGPSIIMLMRHAEDVGERDFNLSPRGFQRAAALPKLFGSRLPKPDIIIATRASKGSNRPMETVEPLARALDLPIDNRFRDDDYRTLAKYLMTDQRYDGKVVLVCWHHGKLEQLARALGVKDAPVWPDDQFDHVWVLGRDSGRKRFEDVHQKLLDGDH